MEDLQEKMSNGGLQPPEQHSNLVAAELRNESIDGQADALFKNRSATPVVPPLLIIPPPHSPSRWSSPGLASPMVHLHAAATVPFGSPTTTTLQPIASSQWAGRIATTSRSARCSTVAARMMHRKYPLTVVIPSDSLTARGEPSLEALKKAFLSHAILLDFVAIHHKLPLGIFIVPHSVSGDFQEWSCAIFITEGLYRTGIFRFLLKFPESYPNGKLRVSFLNPFPFHSLVNQTTGEVYLDAAGERVSKSFEVLDFVKQLFYNVDLLSYSSIKRILASTDPLTQEGTTLAGPKNEPQRTDTQEPEPKATEVTSSTRRGQEPQPSGEAIVESVIESPVMPANPAERLKLIDNCIKRSIAAWSSTDGLKFFASAAPLSNLPKQDFVDGMLQAISDFSSDPLQAKELLINWIDEKAELATRAGHTITTNPAGDKWPTTTRQ